jgi:DNA-directed RNA polymerase specialized sigma24 family protein
MVRSQQKTHEVPSPKRTWEVTREAFDRLLAALAADREQAGELYVALRKRLTFFFERKFERKGRRSAEELTDETINRVSRRLAEGELIQNLSGYCYRVAQHVAQEHWKECATREEALDEATSPARDPEQEARVHEAERRSQQRFACMRACLHELAEQDRALIVRHCTAERGERAQLAAELGLTLNALRLRVFHIRAKLKPCRDRCLSKLARG